MVIVCALSGIIDSGRWDGGFGSPPTIIGCIATIDFPVT